MTEHQSTFLQKLVRFTAAKHMLLLLVVVTKNSLVLDHVPATFGCVQSWSECAEPDTNQMYIIHNYLPHVHQFTS